MTTIIVTGQSNHGHRVPEAVNQLPTRLFNLLEEIDKLGYKVEVPMTEEALTGYAAMAAKEPERKVPVTAVSFHIAPKATRTKP